jgi:hypothetical protein
MTYLILGNHKKKPVTLETFWKGNLIKDNKK